MGILCLLLSIFLQSQANADSDWEAAVRLAQEGKNAEALVRFAQWDAAAADRGVRSFELHSNMAALAVPLENWHEAVFHQLEGASLTVNPFRIAHSLRTVTLIQNQLMVPDPVSRSWKTTFRFLYAAPIAYSIAAIVIWGILFSLLFGKRRFIFLWILGFILLAGLREGRNRLPALAVVKAEGGVAALFAEPNGAGEGKLSDLPGGTLVEMRETTGSLIRITAPFVGWMKTADLRPLSPR
jgi:hypothetical protein